MIKGVFQWLDATPGFYWLIGVLGTVLPLAWVAWQNGQPSPVASRRGHGLMGGLLLSVVVLAWRWPALFEVRAVSVSEARLIAGALTLEREPRPFHSLDLAGAGPLSATLLLPTHYLGLRQDYFNARLVALLLDCASLAVGYACVRSAFSPLAALLGLLPFALVLAQAGNAEVAGYSTAHPLLFFSVLIVGIFWKNRSPAGFDLRGTKVRWLVAGMALGLLPWVDSQGAAVALGLWTLAAVLALADPQLPWPQRLAGAAWSGGGALYTVALVLALLHGVGSWPDFWLSFVRWHPDDAGRLAVWLPNRSGEFFAHAPGLWLGLLPLVWLRLYRAGLPREVRSVRTWVVAAGAIFAGVALGWGREDRAGWLLLGGASIASAAAVVVGEALVLTQSARAKRWIIRLFAAVAVGGQFVVLVAQGSPGVAGHFSGYWRHPRGELAQVIHASQRSGDTLAVWGSGAQYHAETGLSQAVRTSYSVQELAETAYRDTFFRPRYLADLQRNEPAFFVDATGTGDWADRGRYGHECFPELADYIRENYRLAHDEPAARLYIRHSRQIAIMLAQPGVVPVGLDRLQVVKVFAKVADIGEARIMAHAPSTLKCSIPSGARQLRGVFGFIPSAYAAPHRGTSGAEFSVSVLGDHGRREQLLVRWLRPLTLKADRGPIEFAVEMPEGDVREIEFNIDPGNANAFAWSYWGDLRFER